MEHPQFKLARLLNRGRPGPAIDTRVKMHGNQGNVKVDVSKASGSSPAAHLDGAPKLPPPVFQSKSTHSDDTGQLMGTLAAYNQELGDHAGSWDARHKLSVAVPHGTDSAISLQPRNFVPGAERAQAIFHTTQDWLSRLSSPFSVEDMRLFLDSNWEPPLLPAEKDWILQRSLARCLLAVCAGRARSRIQIVQPGLRPSSRTHGCVRERE